MDKKDINYLIIKDKNSKSVTYFEYDKIKGYHLKPKNTPFKDCINVNKMIIVNPSLIDTLITKKINNRFNKLIKLVTYLYEENDPSGEGYHLALNEISKFRMELINKYRMYLSEEKLKLLDNKLSILETEINLKLEYLYEEANHNYEHEGKSR